MPLYLKRTIFIALILISIKNSNQVIEFTPEKIERGSYPCKSDGEYDFDIIGTFSDSVSSFDTIVFDVETSDGRKLQSKCSPFKFLSSKFMCHIDVRYPLDKIDILLPTKTPIVDKYSFKNWETVFGANPGVSNKIEDVTCLPEEKNTFIPSSITVGDCFLGSRSFTIKGEWELKDNADLMDYSRTKIVLDNKDGNISECTYKTELSGFDCELVGEGEIKMKEQYFKASSNVYKMKEFNSGKTSKKCTDKDDEDYIDKIISGGSLLFINKILIIITLLLL